MTPTEQRFTSHDGVELFYRAWLPAAPATRALMLFHRGHEHSARWSETIAALALTDTAVFAWDQRGHGQSPGERGHAAGGLAAVARDAECFARHLVREHGVDLRETIVVGSSVGGVIATMWVHDYAPPIRGLVLATPAFRVKLYVPLAIPSLRLKQATIGPGIVKSYVKSTVLTHDPQQAAAYDADPAIFRQISVDLLLDLHDAGNRLVADAGAITAPTLILVAGQDWVVATKAQTTFYERLGSQVKQLEYLPGFYHSIFHESGRAQVVTRVRAFIDDCFARPATGPDLVHADKGGHTRREYDQLRLPGGPQWAITRAFLGTVGRLSHGIRLGCDTGFDSGATLDYVYENRTQGTTPLGWIIDWFYLNSIGWRGIRVRREHLEELLRATIDATHAAGQSVHVLDLAAGAGRYVIDTLRDLPPEIAASATLRDYRQANLDAARALATAAGLDRIDYVNADAFDRDSIAASTPTPTIGIISGLFELFPENEPLRRSLAGMADALSPGAHLIYTCQPWHPQVEFIARSLTNREGEPWIMRRRSQAEMDALVAAAGFEKIDQRIDRWGIFTVSVARRVAP